MARMIDLQIVMFYETQGVKKHSEFFPVSYSTLKGSKELSFGVPSKIKRIIDCKSFKLLDIPSLSYEGLNLNYTEMGKSVNGHNLFLHFEPYR